MVRDKRRTLKLLYFRERRTQIPDLATRFELRDDSDGEAARLCLCLRLRLRLLQKGEALSIRDFWWRSKYWTPTGENAGIGRKPQSGDDEMKGEQKWNIF